jgi:hypothetical protein
MSSWTANVLISKDENGSFSVYCTTGGATEADCLDGAQFVLAALTTGKQCFLRAEPQATSEKNFETDTTEVRGYTRFLFTDKPGVTVRREDTVEYVGLGLPTAVLA